MDMSKIAMVTDKLSAHKYQDWISIDVLSCFIEFIAEAEDQELFRTSPIRFAEKYNVDKLSAVNLFLIATYEGVLEFNWGTLCPSCGAFITTEIGLHHLESEANCSLCALCYSPDFDNSVEIAFTVASEIRRIRFHDIEDIDLQKDWMSIHFSTSTALFPKIHKIVHSSFQQGYKLRGGEKYSFQLQLDTNHYLFISPANHAVAHVAVSEDNLPKGLTLEVKPDGSISPEITQLAPGNVDVTIINHCSNAILIGLHKSEHMSPTPQEERPEKIPPLFTLTPYLTGKELITLQLFRNLFPKESVPAQDGIDFNDITFVFVDIKGSTAMYDRLGDYEAYKLVSARFDLIRNIIAEHRGAVVKTMGDGVMASFAKASDAVVAAIEMKSKATPSADMDDLELKIGIHNGPSIAVNTNEQLDFFGQTVNIASRIQGLALPGEVVVSESIQKCPDVHQVVESQGLKLCENKEVLLKGVSAPINICKLIGA